MQAPKALVSEDFFHFAVQKRSLPEITCWQSRTLRPKPLISVAERNEKKQKKNRKNVNKAS